jgi:hypothetical protein
MCRLSLFVALVSLLASSISAQDDPSVDRTADTATDSSPDSKKPQPAAATKPRPNTADEGDSANSKPPQDPNTVTVYLQDGTILHGKLTIEEIKLTTEFGSLIVPIGKIIEIRPGLNSRPQLNSEIADLIEDLGGTDFKQRDLAQKKLLSKGIAVRGILNSHKPDGNAERTRRIDEVLKKLDAEADDEDETANAKEFQNEDTMRTTKFVVSGKISPTRFQLKNRFGLLTFNLADIKVLRSGAKTVQKDIRRSISLPGEFLAQLKFKSSGIQVEVGDKITITASGMINRSGSSTYVSTPAGSSRFGQYSQSPVIAGGTLVAKIGSGKVMKVGTKATIIAKRTGTLRFAIGMRPDYVGRYQFLGQYSLKVRVQSGGKSK